MTSKNQLKGHFVVKRRVLVVFDPDIQTVPNCIDLRNSNLVLFGLFDAIFYASSHQNVAVSDLIMIISGHGNLNSCY